jgi:hypothetical protein
MTGGAAAWPLKSWRGYRAKIRALQELRKDNGWKSRLTATLPGTFMFLF